MGNQKCEVIPLGPAQSMPAEMKQHILQLVEYLGAKPIHEIGETQEDIYERPAMDLLGVFAPRVRFSLIECRSSFRVGALAVCVSSVNETGDGTVSGRHRVSRSVSGWMWRSLTS